MVERKFSELWKVGEGDSFIPIKSHRAGSVWAHLYNIRGNNYVRFSYSKRGVVTSREVFRSGILLQDLTCVIGAAIYVKALSIKKNGWLRVARRRGRLSAMQVWEALRSTMEDDEKTREKIVNLKERRDEIIQKGQAARIRAVAAAKRRAEKRKERSKLNERLENGEQ